MSSPLRSTWPPVGSSRPQHSFIKVVLPEPFSPTTARRLPTWNFMFTWRRAHVSVLGYRKDTSRSSRV